MIGRTFGLAILLLVSAELSAEELRELSLQDAVRITLEEHPFLDVYPLRDAGLRGSRAQAALRPALRLGLEVENAVGTGRLRALESSESTLSLSSVVELGGDRAARVALAEAALERNAADQRVRALDLITETTLAFVDAVASRERLEVATEASKLAEETRDTVARRVERGLSPRPELLRAEAQLRNARLGVAKANLNLDIARVALATRMGRRGLQVSDVVGDLFAFDSVANVDELLSRAERNPMLQVLTNEERLREASIALERARARVDLTWSIGIRYLENAGDSGFVASASLPLRQNARSRGPLRAAVASREEVPIRREAAMLDLYARLFEAHRMRIWGAEAVAVLINENMPALEKALQLTTEAYRRGRNTYLDVLATQQEWLDTRSRLIEIAAATAEAGVRLEQLTAESPSVRRSATR